MNTGPLLAPHDTTELYLDPGLLTAPQVSFPDNPDAQTIQMSFPDNPDAPDPGGSPQVYTSN